jgi:hypothetical protein
MGGGGEGRKIISHVYYESEDSDGVSGVEVGGDKGLDDTSDIVGIGPKLCFFPISYTYLTTPELSPNTHFSSSSSFFCSSIDEGTDKGIDLTFTNISSFSLFCLIPAVSTESPKGEDTSCV